MSDGSHVCPLAPDDCTRDSKQDPSAPFPGQLDWAGTKPVRARMQCSGKAPPQRLEEWPGRRKDEGWGEECSRSRQQYIVWKVRWGSKRGLLTLTILPRELKLRKSQHKYFVDLTHLGLFLIKIFAQEIGWHIQ